MLVLSRKIGEEIIVPLQGIVLSILDVRGDKVRVGISAPAEVQVYRRELWERIQAGTAAGESAVVNGGPGAETVGDGAASSV